MMTKIKHKISKDSLIYHIQSEGLTDRQIAKIYNLSPNKIHRTRDKYNIPHFRKWRLSLLPTHLYCQGYKKCFLLNTSLRSDCNYVQYCRIFLSQKKFKEQCLKHIGGVCNHCGEDRQALLEFHHLGEKKQNISILIRNFLQGADFSTFNTDEIPDELLTELDKCEILCSNCHKLSY